MVYQKLHILFLSQKQEAGTIARAREKIVHGTKTSCLSQRVFRDRESPIPYTKKNKINTWTALLSLVIVG